MKLCCCLGHLPITPGKAPLAVPGKSLHFEIWGLRRTVRPKQGSPRNWGVPWLATSLAPHATLLLLGFPKRLEISQPTGSPGVWVLAPPQGWAG